MELADIGQFFRNIKNNYVEFLFGLIAGLVMFALISMVAISFLIFLGIVNILISGMVLLKITPKHLAGSNPAKDDGYVCPECGSSRRHKKTCSIGKARRDQNS